MGFLDKIKKTIYNINTSANTIREMRFKSRIDALEYSVVNNKEPGITEERIAPNEIVVSLTSYGVRLWEAHLAIESIMQQTLKPNKIVLWLEEELRIAKIPNALKLQCNRGLEIKYCKDIKSFKKLVPQLIDTPDAAVITIDDDVIFDPNIIDRFVTSYINEPQFIHCTRAHKIQLDKDGRPLPYLDWEWCTTDTRAGELIFPTGVGGILYPPHSLDSDVLNDDIFMNLCPKADDIWFKAMALKQGTKSKRISTRSESGEDYIENPASQAVSLNSTNLNSTESGNDAQFKAVFDHYDLYDKLK